MKCPSCSSPAATVIRRDLLPSRLGVWTCRRCGLDFFERAVKDDYWSTPGQERIYDDERVEREREAFFETLLTEISPLADGGELLDVGAGRGEFALLAARAGWKVSVVEPSARATEGLAARGVAEVFNCAFEEFDVSARYDCVTLLDLVEHTANPAAILSRAAACVRPGGLVAILTPDARAAVRRVALAASRLSSSLEGLLKYFYYLPHLSYLSARTIEMYAAENGLEIMLAKRMATPKRFLRAKLDAHYGKYRGNRAFAAAVSALYPLASLILANKLFVVARKARA